MLDLDIDYKTILAAGVVVGAFVIYTRYQAKEIVAFVTSEETKEFVDTNLNPVKQNNVFDRMADGLTSALTGGQSNDLGEWIYDKFNN